MIHPNTQTIPDTQETNSNGYFTQKKICTEMDIYHDIKQNWGDSKSYSLDEVFYSPPMDTCIAVVSFHDTVINEETWLYDMLSKSWYMVRSDCGYLEGDYLDICIKNNSRFDTHLENIKPSL